MSEPREGWILFSQSNYLAVPASMGMQIIAKHYHMDCDYNGDKWTLKSAPLKMLVMSAEQMDVILVKDKMVPKDGKS